jgi:hypothetical protein
LLFFVLIRRQRDGKSVLATLVLAANPHGCGRSLQVLEHRDALSARDIPRDPENHLCLDCPEKYSRQSLTG